MTDATKPRRGPLTMTQKLEELYTAKRKALEKLQARKARLSGELMEVEGQIKAADRELAQAEVALGRDKPPAAAPEEPKRNHARAAAE